MQSDHRPNQGFAIEAESRVLQFASLTFDASVSEIFTTLCQGASLQIAAAGRALVGEALVERVRQGAVTHVTLPPAVLAGLPEQADLGSIGALVVAGDASAEGLVRNWARGRRMFNAYGPTETTVCASFQELKAETNGNPPIGRPIANARIYLLDRHGEPAGRGSQ